MGGWGDSDEAQIEAFARSVLAAAKKFPRYEFADLRDLHLWRLEHVAQYAKSARLRVKVQQFLLGLSPEFRALRAGDTSVTLDQRSLTITWLGSLSPTSPEPSRPSSTTALPDSVPAQAVSSATDDLESL